MKNIIFPRIFLFLCAFILAVLPACCAGAETAPAFAHPYGVFLSITSNLEQFADYETVVVDAQYYSAEEIASLAEAGIVK